MESKEVPHSVLSVFQVPKPNEKLVRMGKKELREDDIVIALISIIVVCVALLEHDMFFENGY